MEIKPYFEKIEDVIIEDIKSSKKELLMAVAWFTNQKIFDVIIEKLNSISDFKAKLIVINDNINNRIGGLDFQRFVSAGGCLFFAEKNIPMHNKYMVIDSTIVITGSYNYTYYAESLNEENIIRINGGGDIVQSYVNNFNDLVEGKTAVKNVKEYLTVFPPFIDMFSYNHYALKDISLQADYYKQTEQIAEAQTLMENIEEAESQNGLKNFVINDIIYEQWKTEYYIDSIEVRSKRVKIKFRTIVSDSCWICAPNTRSSWILRSSNDKSISANCYAVKNVYINQELIINQAKKGVIYFFYKDVEESDFSDNPCGYEVNEQKQMIDENKNIIPVQQIKIPQNGVLTCDVYFKADESELINGTVDFIEGNGFEKDEIHWNAFKIKMFLNKEKL